MLPWLLLAALVILPVVLRLWADDGPRRDEDDPPDIGSGDQDPGPAGSGLSLS